MDDYDIRQYRRMLDCIHLFRSKEIGFGKCINNLKALIACLQSPDPELRNILQRKWAVLEEVNAVAEDRGYELIPADHQNLVQSTLDEMETLLGGAVDGFTPPQP
jgi:hypothetical protein